MSSQVEGEHLEAKLQSITDSFVCSLKAALWSEQEALCTSYKQIIGDLKQQLQLANDRIASLEQELGKENRQAGRGADSLDAEDAAMQNLSDTQATQCSPVKHDRGPPLRQPVFKETTRSKQERKRMHGHDCSCCAKVKQQFP